MATEQGTFNSATLGAGNDQVTIEFGLAQQNQLYICSSYSIEMGIFDQPSSFSVTLGTGDLAADLLKRYPNGSPFRINIGGQTQFTGYTDGFDASDNGSATEITFEGRDILAAICDTEIEKEDSFQAATHVELVRLAIARVGLIKPFEVDPPLVLDSNRVNRIKTTGQNIVAQQDSSEAQLLQTAGSSGDQYKVLRTHLGETLMNLLRRHLDSAGLFIWAAASGDIVVGVPNSKQPPLYHLVRKRGSSPTSNVVRARYRDSFRPRFSEVVILGKTTGRKASRVTIGGAYTDDEVVTAGITKLRVLRNLDATSTAHCEHLAKKELAACRRRGFVFEYTLAGHSAPSLLTGGKTRAVFAPDTVVQIDDDEFNLHGNFWIEAVTHRRDPKTTTTIKMLSPDVLIFGDDAFPTPT